MAITSGTIEEDSNFDPEIDVLKLRLALKEGIEKDISVEKTIAQILVKRTNSQRQSTIELYRQHFDVDLCEDIQQVVNDGNFFKTVKALLQKPRDFDAECLKKAIVDGKENVISEIICTRSKSELDEILCIYETEFESTVQEDLDNFIDDHRHIYLALLESPRDHDTSEPDEAKVADHLSTLITAEKSMWDLTKNPQVVTILTQNNFIHLRAVFKEFQKRDKGNMEMIESSIKRCCKNKAGNCLVTWVKSIKNVTRLFSELIYQSVTEMVAENSTVIRIVVGRSEIDLTQIKSHYMMQYNKQLQLAVQQKCGNDHAYSNIISVIIKN